MAAGFFSKTLSTLLSSASRWVEFADGTTAPTHGSVLLDPATGLAVDLSIASPVMLKDGDAIVSSLSAIGTFPIIDMADAEAVSLQVTGTFTGGAYDFAQSNDGATWITVPARRADNETVLAAAGGTTLYRIARWGRYLRVRLNAITTGTVTLTAVPIRAAFPNTEPNDNSTRISTATGTTVKSGAGVLSGISINTKGVAATASVYDGTNASGALKAVIDLTDFGSARNLKRMVFGTGLHVVTTGSTPADITVLYQ